MAAGAPAGAPSGMAGAGASPRAQGGMLSLVGTPIGNLDDASPRVIQTLRSADLLLCEDTRVTSKLLARFDVRVPLWRADENVLAEKVAPALERVEAGGRVAFVSDAGMPGVSDPGQKLVDAALDRGLPVEVIPGPSAVTCALVASGLPMEHFFFEGFLPRKAGAQRERLEALARIPGALVVYESPHRVVQTLGAIGEVMGGRRVALVRELTKVHEECVRGTAAEVAAAIEARGALKGECVLVIAPPTEAELQERERAGAGAPQGIEDAARAGLAAGEPKSALAKRLSKAYGRPRSDVYDMVLRLSSAE